MVSESVFSLIVTGGASIVLILGTAIYLNRKKLNSLYQRLFGMEADTSDEGYIIEMNEKLDKLAAKMEADHQAVMQRLDD